MSYEYLADVVAKLAKNGPGPYLGNNDSGEAVTLYQSEDGNYYVVETLQSNGVCRVNTYYEDGTVTEWYEICR